MALHFVATSVLTSEDGIGFEKEVQLESDDARKSKAEAIKVKPLFEQLAEQNAKKQEEYDAMTKLIFAPPKALDTEDVDYFESIENKKAEVTKRRKEIEDEALKGFRASKNQIKPERDNMIAISVGQKEEKDVLRALAVKPKKRKRISRVDSPGEIQSALIESETGVHLPDPSLSYTLEKLGMAQCDSE